MDKVYIVTKGSYSDYHICGAFRTEELAQKYIGAHKEEDTYSDFNDIEEYVLDSDEESLRAGFRLHFVRMTQEGEASDCYVSSSTYAEPGAHGFDIHGNLYRYLYARDQEHAIKSTNDLRIQLLVSEQWGNKSE